MAILNIRQLGDPMLAKPCKPVREITPRIEQLIDDMLETMYETSGVGLAAPQVGVLKRIVVIDTTPDPTEEQAQKAEELLAKGDEDAAADVLPEPQLYVMINPEIIEKSEETQRGIEGCLSYDGMSGIVTRPKRVKVRYTDEDGNEQELEGEGLLARCICHEVDHLDGKMYVDLAEGEVLPTEELIKLLEEKK